MAVNLTVIGAAPGEATGKLYQAMAQAVASIAQNGATAQQQMNISGQASVTMAVSTLYSLDVAAMSKPKGPASPSS